MILTWRKAAAPIALQWSGLDNETRAAVERDGATALAAVIGLPGPSNYELWLAEGNTGTVGDYLTTLRSIFIQDGKPTGVVGPFLWVQTNFGTGHTIWFEDGTGA